MRREGKELRSHFLKNGEYIRVPFKKDRITSRMIFNIYVM